MAAWFAWTAMFDFYVEDIKFGQEIAAGVIASWATP